MEKKIHTIYEPFHEKTNIMASAVYLDPDQYTQSAQANPGRYTPSLGLGYIVMITEMDIPQEAKSVSVRVSLRGILRLIRIDTLRRVHNLGFLVIRLI